MQLFSPFANLPAADAEAEAVAADAAGVQKAATEEMDKRDCAWQHFQQRNREAGVIAGAATTVVSASGASEVGDAAETTDSCDWQQGLEWLQYIVAQI
eukprot:CAMPEP_0172534726 /NCGR_PEP_ID=MMETSP1067-20121228/6986_1 /TAXON_ID=265564 ORGANISM="Thalassiosira punctigera, Strain Tpunct2005C2" /NCGR_SAMPLE_ID=MMETSP1067 /ASSEMBLY_ACC=CAM_ASM_000444 /LENGTH=97 /DNA_ID=CAMNT_0013319549 /DNA_START=744 /DNA_END=1038 /DNA_ORIENTATION=+